jgi:hypothetical protein
MIAVQILLGGGQDAMSVTTTSLRQGKFETRFWHKIFEEEVGRVKGHFGPVNTCVSSLLCVSAIHSSFIAESRCHLVVTATLREARMAS